MAAENPPLTPETLRQHCPSRLHEEDEPCSRRPGAMRICAICQMADLWSADQQALSKANAELDLRRNVMSRYPFCSDHRDKVRSDPCYACEVERLQTQLTALQGEKERLERTNRILELAMPLEEDLAIRIDEMCRYLSMEDGFTLNGIARLLIECQKRMAADWVEIGRIRRELKHAEAHGRAQMLREVIDYLRAQDRTHKPTDHQIGWEAACDALATFSPQTEPAKESR